MPTILNCNSSSTVLESRHTISQYDQPAGSNRLVYARHSAVDVNIYGTIGSHDLRGNNENTDVGKFLRDYLDVDVHKVTEELATSSKAFIESVGAGVPYTGRFQLRKAFVRF